MADSTLTVPRHPFDLEDPWAAPDKSAVTTFTSALDGTRPRLQTVCRLFHDAERLYFLFSGEDDHIRASYAGHDEPLYEEDVLEIFLSPDDPKRYFEIEVNPLGTLFDAQVLSPDGDRRTMTVDRGWKCDGLWAALRRWISGDSISFDTVVSVPFQALGAAPSAGTTWRANLYRIDRHERGDEYTAWRPTMKQPADFHVPASFGTLIFE